MMLDKILVAVECSENDGCIFDTAVSLAQATDASLMLLHILSEEDSDYPMLPTYAYYSVLKDSEDGLFQAKFAEYEQKKLDLLKNLAQKALDAGVDAEYAQFSGIPGSEICELAELWSADLIMVGSRGLQGLKEMFLGSVSNYITHHAPCSVLIVRTDSDADSGSVGDRLEQVAKID